MNKKKSQFLRLAFKEPYLFTLLRLSAGELVPFSIKARKYFSTEDSERWRGERERCLGEYEG